jgi:hypothetical protein
MSTHPGSAHAPRGGERGRSSWTLVTATAVGMALLALVGVGLAMSNSNASQSYWIALVPVFGVLCVLTAWYRGVDTRASVLRQILHWAGIGLAVGIDFAYIKKAGEETSLSAGLNSLLLLALGCYLAGVHMEWLFILAGALLTLILVVVVVGEQYLPFLFGVGVVVIILMVVVHRYFRVRATPPHPPTATPVK